VLTPLPLTRVALEVEAQTGTCLVVFRTMKVRTSHQCLNFLVNASYLPEQCMQLTRCSHQC
jgi:hypothetical protein